MNLKHRESSGLQGTWVGPEPGRGAATAALPGRTCSRKAPMQLGDRQRYIRGRLWSPISHWRSPPQEPLPCQLSPAQASPAQHRPATAQPHASHSPAQASHRAAQGSAGPTCQRLYISSRRRRSLPSWPLPLNCSQGQALPHWQATIGQRRRRQQRRRHEVALGPVPAGCSVWQAGPAGQASDSGCIAFRSTESAALVGAAHLAAEGVGKVHVDVGQALGALQAEAGTRGPGVSLVGRGPCRPASMRPAQHGSIAAAPGRRHCTDLVACPAAALRSQDPALGSPCSLGSSLAPQAAHLEHVQRELGPLALLLAQSRCRLPGCRLPGALCIEAAGQPGTAPLLHCSAFAAGMDCACASENFYCGKSNPPSQLT